MGVLPSALRWGHSPQTHFAPPQYDNLCPPLVAAVGGEMYKLGANVVKVLCT